MSRQRVRALKRAMAAAVSMWGMMIASNAIGMGGELKENSNPIGLSAVEQADGWRLLFDGKTTRGWHSFKKQSFPTQGWSIEDGCLRKLPRMRGGDIVSDDSFSDFDLRWEWRLPAKANNGLKYFVLEERDQALGHEYQMVDDAVVRNPKGRTASFYAVLGPRPHQALKPAGAWNQSRVLVRGNHVEHWLNGEKVLEYELGSATVLNNVAESKFKNVAGFGTKVKGHILLTDHGDEVWYRNIRIKELPAQAK